MFQKLIAVAAWACFIFITYATLSSLPARPELTSDETEPIFFMERFGAYALLGSLFCLTYPHRITFVCLLVLGTGLRRAFRIGNGCALSLALLGHMRVSADTRERETWQPVAVSGFQELP
jgi:hypothetical protein